MDRIIPFGYPTIPGGASGGASVDPTPPSSDDPDTPTTLPYNLDGLKAVPTALRNVCEYVGNVWIATGTISQDLRIGRAEDITLEGIVPLDLTEVRQISLTGPTSWRADGVVFTADGVDIRDKITDYSYGINLPRTVGIDKFLNDKTGVIGYGNPRFTVNDYNTYVKGKQIVVSFPVHVEVLDAQGEILQSADMAVSL